MLPNWLYGKSKSKLASILGGGGTPSDYNEVKAQVTQNTEDIAHLDTNNQTLTNQSNSMVNVLGAKNLLPYPYEQTTKTINGVTFTDNGDGSITLNGTNTATNTVFMFNQRTNSRTGEIFSRLKKMNTSFKLLGGINSPMVWIVIDFYDSSGNYISSIHNNSDTPTQFTIPSNAENVNLFIRCSIDAVYSNLTIYPMLYLASITDDTYVPYAMTNEEITDVLTADANLSAPVDLSAYTSYSNLYTAPSDGYVHFLSAASGSAARTIYTYGNNTSAATDPHFTHSTSANNKAFEIFIKKGLKVYIDGLQSGDTINFYPLS